MLSYQKGTSHCICIILLERATCRWYRLRRYNVITQSLMGSRGWQAVYLKCSPPTTTFWNRPFMNDVIPGVDTQLIEFICQFVVINLVERFNKSITIPCLPSLPFSTLYIHVPIVCSWFKLRFTTMFWSEVMLEMANQNESWGWRLQYATIVWKHLQVKDWPVELYWPRICLGLS